MLIELTDPDAVGFELDCFWAVTAGVDPPALLDAVRERAASLRMEAVVVETHKNWIGGSPVGSAEVSAEVLRRLIP